MSMISSNLGRISIDSTARSPEALQVDVIADMVCPWCYLGTRRLNDALAAVRGPRNVSWIPFQLNQAMPEGGMPLNDYLRDRFGDPEALQPALAELTRQGQEEGVQFRFDRIQRIPSTLNAHRLMRLAEATSRDSNTVAELLFKAFFTDGLNIADPDVLVEIGDRQGIPAADVHHALQNDSSRKLVLAQEAQVRQSGISGVPDFLVNRRLLIVGAQSTATLVNVFDRVMFGDESGLVVSDTLH
jgi:predicted DsbA family dithiol-disulfide isomerase